MGLGLPGLSEHGCVAVPSPATSRQQWQPSTLSKAPGRPVRSAQTNQGFGVGSLSCVTICVTTPPLTAGRFGMTQDRRTAQ
jgi:hypothetical protein